MKVYETYSEGDSCPKCGGNLVRKSPPRSYEDIYKKYYYSIIHYCKRCRKVFLSEEYKIINKNYQALTPYLLHRSSLRGQIEAGRYFAILSTALSILSSGGGTLSERLEVFSEIKKDLAELQKNYKIVKL